MLQTLLVKLVPSPEQVASLLTTMERFNVACNFVGNVAFELYTANKVRLQKIVYRDIREKFGLSSQMAVRVISKTCEAYKRDKSIKPSFRPHGSIPYDQRILSWKGPDRVSLLTLGGREMMPYILAAYYAERFHDLRGQVKLIYCNGAFFLAVMVDTAEEPMAQVSDFLGVDMGIVNIAADSDGQTFAGNHVNSLRHRHHRLRQKLQAKGTRSAKRLLVKRKRKESRFAKHVNHTISKRLVAKAKGTTRGIALENLQGIRQRITVRRSQRRTHSSWSFFHLRFCIEYKARLAGVRVIAVDPSNTSRTCPFCGHVDAKNRQSQASFLCVSCGFAGPADTIAAINIGRRAAVNRPHATRTNQCAGLLSCKPATLVAGC